jgi:hypothetical protein
MTTPIRGKPGYITKSPTFTDHFQIFINKSYLPSIVTQTNRAKKMNLIVSHPVHIGYQANRTFGCVDSVSVTFCDYQITDFHHASTKSLSR